MILAEYELKAPSYFSWCIILIKHLYVTSFQSLINVSVMSSASFQWKKFPFFDPAGSKLNLKENVSEEEEIKVTCASSGRGNIFVGDSKGSVWRLTKDSDGGKQLAITTHDPFQAWQTEAKELRQLRQKPYLIGLGKDDFVTVMKMWNIDKCDASGAPAPVRSDRLTRQVC